MLEKVLLQSNRSFPLPLFFFILFFLWFSQHPSLLTGLLSTTSLHRRIFFFDASMIELFWERLTHVLPSQEVRVILWQTLVSALSDVPFPLSFSSSGQSSLIRPFVSVVILRIIDVPENEIRLLRKKSFQFDSQNLSRNVRSHGFLRRFSDRILTARVRLPQCPKGLSARAHAWDIREWSMDSSHTNLELKQLMGLHPLSDGMNETL